jgi:hypothetical protein
MASRHRLRLRALGLHEDPLYWTRPVPISELINAKVPRSQLANTGQKPKMLQTDYISGNTGQHILSRNVYKRTLFTKEKDFFEDLLFVTSGYLVQSQEICSVLHLVPAATRHGVFSE